MSNNVERADEMMRGLVREQCYLLKMRRTDAPPPDPEENARIRLLHHDYLVELERDGIIVGAGPCRDADGVFSDAAIGLWIVRAKTRAEAEAIVAKEPYVVAGQRVIDLIPWQRNEGDTTITLRLAERTLEMDRRRWKISPAD